MMTFVSCAKLEDVVISTGSNKYSEDENDLSVESEISAETSYEDTIEQKVEEWLEEHSVEEKIAQMFMITPEALTGADTVTLAGQTTENAIIKYPVGGIIYFSQNLINPDQTKELLENTKDFYKENGIIYPFLAVDEEGGSVARIGNNNNFDVPHIPSSQSIGDAGDIAKAAEEGSLLALYLSSYGFNMDMAPDADVLSNPNNKVVGNRSFGADSNLVSDMVIAESKAMSDGGIIPVIKHFPGHGSTEADSHKGYAYTNKTLDELMGCELVPFRDSIENGINVIMVGHISVPNITGDYLPSSLSSYMITDVLREQLGFDGVVITDAMNMGAINNSYSAGDATVMAINAGADIILMPQDFGSAYEAVINALKDGTISEDRIDESVKRIVELKYKVVQD